MTQEEFNERTGLDVSASEFSTIHQMYMYTEFDKDSFCAEYVKHGKSDIVLHLMNELDRTISDKVCVKTDLDQAVILAQTTAEMLIRKSVECLDNEMYDTAINLIGMEACVAYKLKEDIELTEADRHFLIDAISKN